MTFSPTAARQALAAQIEAALNASGQPANVHAHPHGSPLTNAVLIMPRAGDDGLYINYRQTYGPRSNCILALWVEIRTGGDSPNAEMEMDRYLTPGTAECVFDAIESDLTLGGVVGNCVVDKGVAPPNWFTESAEGGRNWYAARFAVQISEQR